MLAIRTAVKQIQQLLAVSRNNHKCQIEKTQQTAKLLFFLSTVCLGSCDFCDHVNVGLVKRFHHACLLKQLPETPVKLAKTLPKILEKY